MKIDYTIPGWQPDPRPRDPDAPREASFHSRLAEVQIKRPPALQKMLRLQPSHRREFIPPPPRPAGLPKMDAIQERNAFRAAVLERSAAVDTSAVSGRDRAVIEKMVHFLTDALQREDEITARSFAFRES